MRDFAVLTEPFCGVGPARNLARENNLRWHYPSLFARGSPLRGGAPSGRAPLGSGGVSSLMVVGGMGGLALRDLRNGVWEMSDVFLTVDGSCLGNPGPGGWACILRYGEEERVLRGGVAQTTNNRMEMMAAIEGLRVLSRPCDVEVATDSDYLRRGMTEFLERWRSNGWKTASGSPVLNQDLWRELDDLAGYHRLTWIHVGGHSGHPDQERCDALALESARQTKRDSVTSC